MVPGWAKVATILVVVVGTYLLGKRSDHPPPATPPLGIEGSQSEPSPEAKLALARQIDAKARENAEWQVAVLKARALKQSMKNPDSFKLDQLLKMSDGSLCFSYRATNSFNAIVPGYAVAVEDKFIADGSPGFKPLWNKRCDGKQGDDLTNVRVAM